MDIKVNNKLQKILLIIILCICLISTLFTTSKAADNFTTKLTASSTTVEAGDEITVGIVLTNINVGNGIQAIQGTLTYDTEKLTYSNITASNGWGSPVYNPANGMIVVESSNYVTTEQEILKVTFKVKEGIEPGNAQIQFSEVQASDGEIMADGTGASITLNIREAEPEDNTNETGNNNTNNTNNTNQAGDNNTNNTNQAGNNTNSTNQAGNNNTNNTNQTGNNNAGNNNGSNTNQQANNQNSSRNNTSINASRNNQATTTQNLPKTGLNNTIIIAVAIVILAAIISFIKYKKYKGIK